MQSFFNKPVHREFIENLGHICCTKKFKRKKNVTLKCP